VAEKSKLHGHVNRFIPQNGSPVIRPIIKGEGNFRIIVKRLDAGVGQISCKVHRRRHGQGMSDATEN
jgi:hypothetical protein